MKTLKSVLPRKLHPAKINRYTVCTLKMNCYMYVNFVSRGMHFLEKCRLHTKAKKLVLDISNNDHVCMCVCVCVLLMTSFSKTHYNVTFHTDSSSGGEFLYHLWPVGQRSYTRVGSSVCFSIWGRRPKLEGKFPFHRVREALYETLMYTTDQMQGITCTRFNCVRLQH